MNSEKIYDAITEIREDYIDEASGHRFNKSPRSAIRWYAIAASFILVICIGSYVLMNTDLIPRPGGNAGGGGRMDGSATFMSYAGPVFPLSVLGGADGITASRNINFDFNGFGETRTAENGELLHNDILINDDYILTNNTAHDKTVQIFYPFASSFLDIYKTLPVISADGNTLDTELIAGTYSGNFTGVDNNDTRALNMLPLNSWEDYITLLSDGTYLANALSESVALNQPVTVYRIYNIDADHDKAPAATLALSFNLDYSKTTVLSYGFNGMEQNIENGFMRRSFFVPQENANHGYYLIVIGSDVDNLTMQGYKNGGCHKGDEIDYVNADMERYETTFGEIFELLFYDYWNSIVEPINEPVNFDISLLHRTAAELFYHYGALSENAVERYDIGELFDIFSEAYRMDRVFYLTAEITIPAGKSVAVDITQIKPGSYDFYGAKSGYTGVNGYDMLTKLDSSLTFTDISAEITGAERIEIVRQNFGFDLVNGIMSVTLDTYEPHYYLEVRRSDIE